MTQKDREREKNRIAKRQRRSASQKKYLTDLDLAERWGCSRDTIWRWNRLHSIPPPTRLGPNCTRWRLDRIEEWEDEREEQA